MKRFLIALLFCAATLAQTVGRPAEFAAKLTNRDILEMRAAGLSHGIIVAKIRAADCDFDTSPKTLAALKTAGISEDVILAMIERPSVPSSNTTSNGTRTRNESEPKATLCFYRERAFVGSARKMPIYIDEVKVADLVNGRHFTMQTEPGKHVFRCRTREEAIQVDIEPGQDYYLRAELIQGFTKNHWRIVQLTKQQGQQDIIKLKPLDAKDISPLARMPN